MSEVGEAFDIVGHVIAYAVNDSAVDVILGLVVIVGLAAVLDLQLYRWLFGWWWDQLYYQHIWEIPMVYHRRG